VPAHRSGLWPAPIEARPDPWAPSGLRGERLKAAPNSEIMYVRMFQLCPLQSVATKTGQTGEAKTMHPTPPPVRRLNCFCNIHSEGA